MYEDVSLDTHQAEEYIATEIAENHQAFHDSVLPANLPVAKTVIGYEAFNSPELNEESLDLNDLENQAHAQKVLLSSDAMRYFITQVTAKEERVTVLDTVIKKARVSFPSEDGWVILNLMRMEELVDVVLTVEPDQSGVKKAVNTDLESSTSYTPMTAGSLAEAILSKDTSLAFMLSAERPMIALADAVSDITKVLEAKTGQDVNVSNLLKDQTQELSSADIEALLLALTSALDGTHQDEDSAVKMAITKAVASLK